MAEIRLTEGDDVFDQAARGVANYSEPVYGLGGNDRFILTGLIAVGGPGNDRIEAATAPNSNPSAAYWDGPSGAWVDLQAGTATDGWGGTDTLVGVREVHGGWLDDTVLGSAGDDQFWPNGGHDLFDGRGGYDTLGLPGVLADYTVEVSVDGRHATVRKPAEPSLRYELTDVERLHFWVSGASGRDVPLVDLIRLADLATQTLSAGASLRWNASQAPGTPVALTYSFMQAAPVYGGMPGSGFQSFDAGRQQVVEQVLARIASETGISFGRVDDSPNAYGQIRFGISQQSSTTGFSYYPDQAGAGERAGDVWMDVETVADLSVGGVGYAMLLHEIGHALGLRHPGNYLPGETLWPVLPQSDDDTAHSVMSYNGQFDALARDWFGAYDLLALRALYGTQQVHTGHDTWTLGDEAGQAMRLIVDDGGHDSIDASAVSLGVRLDLSVSLLGSLALSSVGLTRDGAAALDNLALLPGTVIEDAIGTAFDDVLIGNAADNKITGGTGNDVIDGAEGLDTAVFAGARDAYALARALAPDTLTVSARDGAGGFDTLVSIERLRFEDFSVSLTVQHAAASLGAAALQRLEELYIAFFNRVPDADGLEYWIGQFNAGQSIVQIAESFYNAGVQYSGITGYSPGMTHADFVDTVYRNVLGRSEGADEGGLSYWTGELAAGRESRGSLVSTILDSAHTFKGDATWGWVADLLDNKVAVAETFALAWGLNYNTPQESIAMGMAIAAAVTADGIDAAIALIGIDAGEPDFTGGA